MNEIELEKKLEKIDNKLDSINTYILQTALQQKDIENLKEELTELKLEQKEIKAQLETIKNQPTKEKAKVFDSIAKYIGTAILGAVSTALFIGLKILLTK